MRYTFEIPSICTEVVVVEAESKEEAAYKIINGEDYEHHIPESEFSINMELDVVLDYLT